MAFLFHGHTATREFKPGSPTAREHFGRYGGRLEVEYGLAHPGPRSPQAPHVSVTCTWTSNASGGTHVGGGADHESVAKFFPQLRPLIPWHLWGSTGRNMHYCANGVYWYEHVRGWRQPSRYEKDVDYVARFHRSIAWGLIPGDDDDPVLWPLAELPDDRDTLVFGGVELVDGKPWAQHAQELLKSRLTTLLEARVPALRQQLTSVLVSLDIDPTWDPRSIPGG
jgi:hypothetical protein